jgi:uracil-DNA glycosylase
LQKWAEQGVFLLNSILTVEAHKPASHRDLGWEQFTDATIQKLSSGRKGIIFLLWGKFAREKRALIDVNRHAILESPHPSPFSAHSGFFGSAPFSNTNRLLQEQGLSPINWSV